jgi:transposase
MAAASPRAIYSGSRLVRLLLNQDLVDGLPPDEGAGRGAQQNDTERLGSWLDWTDAIALSEVLNAGGLAQPSTCRGQLVPDAGAVAATIEACQRVRDDLVKLATADVAYTAGAHSEQPLDFSPYRRDYLAHQRAMEAAIAPLRERVRAALAGHTPAGARLAALDAVLDAALRPRERYLLATLPARLEMHVERLQQVEAGVGERFDEDANDCAEGSRALHQRCHREMQRLLLAELDLRMGPVDGLVQALRLEARPTT